MRELIRELSGGGTTILLPAVTKAVETGALPPPSYPDAVACQLRRR